MRVVVTTVLLSLAILLYAGIVQAEWSLTYDWNNSGDGTVLGWRSDFDAFPSYMYMDHSCSVVGEYSTLRCVAHATTWNYTTMEFFLVWIQDLEPGNRVMASGPISRIPGTGWGWCSFISGFWNDSESDVYQDDGNAEISESISVGLTGRTRRILRRTLRRSTLDRAATPNMDQVGDTSTLADPSAVDALIAEYEKMNK